MKKYLLTVIAAAFLFIGLVSTTEAATKTGWISSKGHWYFYSKPGILYKGWLKSGNNWYFLDNTGVMKTGWVNTGGKRYYLDASGVMKTGWVNTGGKWYYLDASGAIKTGWVNTGGKWYSLDASGAMKTGWVNTGGKWYYLDASGAMKTGWANTGGKWYYLDASGAMKTGWVNIGSNWYYLYSDGSKAVNTAIDGYTLDKNGVRVTEYDMASILKPYLASYNISYNIIMYLGGATYNKGYQFGTYENDEYDFNLQGKYTTINGMIGLDSNSADVTLTINGDGKVLKTLKLKASDGAQTLNLNVTGIKKLQFKMDTEATIYFVNPKIEAANFIVVGPTFDGKDMEDLLKASYASNNVYYNQLMELGGATYNKGYQFTSYGNDEYDFNLQGKYTTINGIIGIESASADVTLTIYGDGKILKTLALSAGDLPQTLSLNVTGVKKLQFKTGNTPDSGIDLVNVKIK